MSIVTQWQVILAFLIAISCLVVNSKVFERCELAKILRERHKLDLEEVAQWVCIAQHSSGFNTNAQAYSPTGGSHGLFQISDVYWCSPPGRGAGCNLSCHKLRDDNINDDLSCLKSIYDEHQRISGDGYTAWTAYQHFCKNNAISYIQDCFSSQTKVSTYLTSAKEYHSYKAQYPANSIKDYSSKKHGKIYKRCELARELYNKHKMPMEQIPTWVCIVEHESRYNTAALGRSNTDGSTDHGLFQISDLYWCSHDRYSEDGDKTCGLSCSKLLDDDITDDVHCVKRIHNEYTSTSGDGFTAWTVYKPYCQNQRYEQVANCFQNTQHNQQQKVQATAVIQSTNKFTFNSNNPFFKNILQQSPTKTYHTSSTNNDIFKMSSTKTSISRRVPHKGKVYTRCTLAQELYFKYKFPIQDISTWVCIAQHQSQFNTAAVGQLNTDGSANYGLFQISDKYWCNHDTYGDKACNLSCDKLLDDDLLDDVQCIKIIHKEHTRISGDGFNAWTVYKSHCKSQNIEHIKSCFDKKTLASNVGNIQKPNHNFAVSKLKGKIYKKCELAQELYHKHHTPMEQIPTWVCIAQHESSFNTAAIGRLNNDGSADHGLFQISDIYWCTHDQYGGKACNIPCDKLLDSDITDDVRCIKIIYEEHTRISGDGFNAWAVYKPYCRNTGVNYVKDCFTEKELKQFNKTIHVSNTNSLVSQSSIGIKPLPKGKIYKKCELAQELYHKHHMTIEQIPTWVCIAQHESSFNTAAVGRLNSDGSADHGLFQISDIYWCTHDQYGGKACNIPCDKLLDSDITDDVRCIKIIYEEHTRISGDGFNAWAVYKPYCRNTGVNYVKDCFTEKELKQFNKTIHLSNTNSLVSQSSIGIKPLPKGKIYKKCELAQELYHKHHMTIEQIPTWVCIAQHESSFNTAAVGRLNSDGSADHGLFQISDIYWCTHDQYGGKACNIPCDKLLDSDITDDVRCIKIIYEEHTRISGDGFNAWAVYKPYCRNTGVNYVKDCFTEKELKQFNKTIHLSNTNSLVSQSSIGIKPLPKGKIYKKCELAQELYHKHHMTIEQIPTWVCIAQHESSFNTAAVGRLNSDGSADHGLFQISDIYWCTHDQYGGKACNIPCDKLLDSDITDDVRCIKIIYEEHTRISGDGFNAWAVYKPYCRNTGVNYVKDCFTEKELKQFNKTIHLSNTNSLVSQSSIGIKPLPKGKIYKKCELAQELYHKHHMTIEQIPTWVCIAQHESSFNTAAVGRLNSDGSADHGLFQISDIYWCTHDQYGGKACNIPCDKLLDSDITDDVRCIKIIYEEHTRISGDGFNAWAVYKPYCRNTGLDYIKNCFTEEELKEYKESTTAIIGNSIKPQHIKIMNVPKGKIYKKCELAQELLCKHKMPMEQIPTWVCIAEHESSFNTAAVGRLNTDGSLDHGLFQISDLYWCSHNQFGGKACNIPCDKLLDSDITDDIRCVQVIHKEHTHISGDGFNAWTVYKPHCRNRKMEDIRTCFSSKQIEEFEKKQIFAYKISDYRPLLHTPQKNSYNNNPFLAGLKLQSKQISQKQTYNQNSILISKNQKLNYTNNPFLQNVKTPTSTEEFKIITNTANDFIAASKKDYKLNPFLNGSIKLSTSTLPNYKQKHNKSKPTYNQNPFLKNILASLANNNITPKPAEVIQNYPVKANILPSENIKLSSSVQPTQSSPQYTTFYETTSIYKSENKKSYLNSNDLRTTATVKPKTTTIARTASWTTTKKPTTLLNTYTTTTKRPTTMTTQMATTTLRSITKKFTTSPKDIISSLQYQNSTQTTTSLNWQSPKYYHTTTTKPIQNTTTTKWNWQSQKYKNNVTIPQTAKNLNSYKLPSTTPRTERTTTNLRNEPILKTTTKPSITQKVTTPKSNWKNEQHVKTTTKLSPKQTSTTIKPTTTTTNWQKNNKTTTTSTTRKYNTTTNTRKPTTKTILSRWNTTVKSITASTIKSSTNTTKPIPLDNQKSSTSKLHNNRTLYNEKIKTTTARPWTTIIRTTLKKPLNTTTQKPLTTKSQTIVDYEKYKNDPFSHPFFAKVNEQIKQLRGNTTTIELPSFKATKLQSFPQSPLYQDFKNSITNKTKTVISYNFEDSKLSSTKRPKL